MRAVDPQILENAQTTVLGAVRQFRLPLSGRLWRGQSGNWAGAGVGSSIDFQDHRAYLPGDDPRHINWSAYARTGHYSMKLYREEVSPHVDLALDASGSMFCEPAKERRAWEMLFFCRESALQAGTSLRIHLIAGEKIREIRPEEFATRGIDLPDTLEGAPLLTNLPWRHGSLRIVITDLLYPPGVGSFCASLASGHGRGILFSLHTREESDPDWQGHLAFIDSETGERVRRYVSADLLERYRRNYARHFGEWEKECRRHSLLFARLPVEPDFVASLQEEPLRKGAVESCL